MKINIGFVFCKLKTSYYRINFEIFQVKKKRGWVGCYMYAFCTFVDYIPYFLNSCKHKQFFFGFCNIISSQFSFQIGCVESEFHHF